jgi:uncharacterized membrane protein
MKVLMLLALLLAPASFADEVDEINRDVEGLQKNMEQVRRVLQERIGGVNGLDQARVEQARRKIMVLASDQKFLKAAGDLWNSPERNTLLIAEAVFFVFMFFFRAWRQAKASNWFTRVLTGFFLSVVTWIGLVLVLPAVILGEPFRQVVSSLWRVVSS